MPSYQMLRCGLLVVLIGCIIVILYVVCVHDTKRKTNDLDEEKKRI